MVYKAGRLTFRADFDSANLASAKEGRLPSEYELSTFHDCHGTAHQTGHRSWFYFSVSGHAKGDFIVMTITNMNKQARLYAHDYRVHYRAHPSMCDFDVIKTRVAYKKLPETSELRFSHKFDTAEETFFAFAIPWSCDDNERLLQRLDGEFLRAAPAAAADLFGDRWRVGGGGVEAEGGADDPSAIYYHRQTLNHTPCGRAVDVVTVSDCCGGGEGCWEPRVSGCCPDEAQGSARDFPDKKVFFVSSRVHPGETPAAHVFNGLLLFLLRSDDARAAALRRAFVFKLIPIVNPDGVSLGHYRQDALGQNLNRHYSAPVAALQPTIFAIHNLVRHYASQGRLEFYLDLHAHANKRGVFTYGNALEGEQHIEELVYSRLVALNSPHFDFAGCNFTEKNMTSRDKDGTSKDGAGRVAFFRLTGLTHLYTIEASYNCSRLAPPPGPPSSVDARCSAAAAPGGGRVPGAGGGPQASAGCGASNVHANSRRYDRAAYHQVGRALLVAALDLKGANPWSRVASSPFGSTQGVRDWVVACIKAAAERKNPLLPAVSEASQNSVRGMAPPRRGAGGTSALTTVRRSRAARHMAPDAAAAVAPPAERPTAFRRRSEFVGAAPPSSGGASAAPRGRRRPSPGGAGARAAVPRARVSASALTSQEQELPSDDDSDDDAAGPLQPTPADLCVVATSGLQNTGSTVASISSGSGEVQGDQPSVSGTAVAPAAQREVGGSCTQAGLGGHAIGSGVALQHASVADSVRESLQSELAGAGPVAESLQARSFGRRSGTLRASADAALRRRLLDGDKAERDLLSGGRAPPPPHKQARVRVSYAGSPSPPYFLGAMAAAANPAPPGRESAASDLGAPRAWAHGSLVGSRQRPWYMRRFSGRASAQAERALAPAAPPVSPPPPPLPEVAQSQLAALPPGPPAPLRLRTPSHRRRPHATAAPDPSDPASSVPPHPAPTTTAEAVAAADQTCTGHTPADLNPASRRGSHRQEAGRVDSCDADSSHSLLPRHIPVDPPPGSHGVDRERGQGASTQVAPPPRRRGALVASRRTPGELVYTPRTSTDAATRDEAPSGGSDGAGVYVDGATCLERASARRSGCAECSDRGRVVMRHAEGRDAACTLAEPACAIMEGGGLSGTGAARLRQPGGGGLGGGVGCINEDVAFEHMRGESLRLIRDADELLMKPFAAAAFADCNGCDAPDGQARMEGRPAAAAWC